MTDRYKLSHKIQHAIRHPERLGGYLRRLLRTRRLTRESGGNFLKFYASLVDHDATNINPNRAIGSEDQDHWAAIGRLQFDYLLKHDLDKAERFLDIGCGNLRLGLHLIEYLECGRYFGIDISPRVISDALRKIDCGLAEKLPHLYLVEATDYSFLPSNYFDRVQAHSVFSHLPMEEIVKVLQQTARVMKSDGQFDFTYLESSQGHGNILNIDFYYSREEMMNVVSRCGMKPEFLEDWDYSQKKIRARKL